MTIASLNLDDSHRSITITMDTIACPETPQSEAYVSTVALFWIFSSSAKEEKAYLRLPGTWRDFWFELSDLKKRQETEQDRTVLRDIRGMIEGSEDGNDGRPVEGITLPASAVKSSTVEIDSNDHPRKAWSSSTDDLKAIWHAKESAPAYQYMLQSRMKLPIWAFKTDLLAAVQSHQVVIICGETGCGKSTQGTRLSSQSP